MAERSQDLHIGDLVVEGGDEGRVVASIDLGEYSAEFPEHEWSHLNTGVLVVFDRAGLVHFSEVPSHLGKTRR